MTIGNAIDHLADDARAKGFAETTWLGLRNTYFSDGSPEDGWEAMLASFKRRGIKATSEWRQMPKGKMEFIVLTPFR